VFGFASADEGAAVLFETEAGILGKAFRIGMQGAQEARDFFAHIFVAQSSLVGQFSHFGLHCNPPLPGALRRSRFGTSAGRKTEGSKKDLVRGDLTYLKMEALVYGTLVPWRRFVKSRRVRTCSLKRGRREK
jgi:hypothetical protein